MIGNGAKRYNIEDVKIKIANYTMTSSDTTIFADASSNPVDISLGLSPIQSQRYTVKCIDATFACKVLRDGKNIDGMANDLTLALNVSRTLEYDETYGWGITC